MTDSIYDRIKASLTTAKELYHRLVLLVGEPASGKTMRLRKIAEELDVEVINVNLALSRELLELTPKQRALSLPAILSKIASQASDPLILDNLEILFDKELQQNPLRLLQLLSRNQTVLASWSGTIDVKGLTYAKPGHPEYRRYDAADAIIVENNG